MVETVKATELQVQEYVASIGLNPDNVFYQRIASTNISVNQAQWQIISPNKRANLLALAWIHWKPVITKRRNDNTTAVNHVNNGIWASFKPGLPFTNAMSSIDSTINSATITLSQPRRFMEHLSLMFGGRQGMKKCFSSCGGEPYMLNGESDNTNATRNLISGWSRHDSALQDNEDSFREKLNRAEGAGVADLNGTNSQTIDCIEPVIIPPFNPFAKLKEGMPDYAWFKHMSPIIPNVSRLELNCQFQNLSQSVLFPRYLRNVADENHRLSITGLTADLILYWYNPPPSMVSPRQHILQTWNVREYVTTVGVVNNNATAASNQTDLIQLHAVPTLIVIHAEVNKDDATYANFAIHSDSDQAGGARINSSQNNNALDSYMEISKFEVLLGDRPQVIGTRFTQEELYYLTLKNSKILDFPYKFNQWRGARVPTGTAGGTTFNQMSKMFIALRPKDLSEKFGDGIRFPTTLQFTMSLTARDGLGNIAGGNKSYTLYTHVYSGKHFLTMTSDSGQYQEQQIDVNQAIQKISTVGGGLASGGRLRLDEPRYVSKL